MYTDWFIIEYCLGSGRFGSVYQVCHRGEQKNYALKIIKAKVDRPALEAAVKEVNTLKDLEHPNIVKMYATFMDTDRPSVGIQMELCEGSLDQFIASRKGKRIPSSQLQEWMLQLSSAVEYIHSKNIVHGDLKPRNILYDQNHVLKIGDFGCAYRTLQEDSVPLRGTVYFVAPEALDGSSCTQSDIYSLGCVFFCLAAVTKEPEIKDGQFVAPPATITYGEKKFSIINWCIEDKKEVRPTAQQIHNILKTDDYETLHLCTLPENGAELSLNEQAITQRNGKPLQAFSNRKLNIEEKFCIKIMNMWKEGKTEVKLGFIEYHPYSYIEEFNVPEKLRAQSVLKTLRLDLAEDKRITIWRSADNVTRMEFDGLVQTFGSRCSASKMWAQMFFGPEVRKVQIKDYE